MHEWGTGAARGCKFFEANSTPTLIFAPGSTRVVGDRINRRLVRLSNGINSAATGIGKPLAFLSEAGLWIIGLLAAAALVATLFAVLLYMTGRGIARHARWARIAAIMLATVFLLVSLVALTSLRHDIAPLAGLPIALFLYTIWALGWGYG